MREVSLIILVALCLFGVISGVMDSASRKSVGRSGCDYSSIASINPTRVIVCELLRDRW